MAGVTRCRNAAIDAEAELPTDSLAAWRARGWEPITGDRTLEEAEIERVTAENEAAALVEPADLPPVPAEQDDPVADAAVAEQTQEMPIPAGDAGTQKES